MAGKSKKEAALLAGCPPSGARQQGYQMMNNPAVKHELAKLLERSGLGPDRIMLEVNKALKKAKLGSHAEYLRMLIGLNDMNPKKARMQDGVKINFNSLVMEAKKRGIDIPKVEPEPVEVIPDPIPEEQLPIEPIGADVEPIGEPKEVELPNENNIIDSKPTESQG